MKTQVQKLNLLILLITILPMIFAGCSEEADPGDPKPEPNPVGTVDVNKIAQGLKFRNGTVITGTLPANSAKLADLKIDTDTIFWVEGIKNRIKILKPAGQQIASGSFYAQVADAKSYITAEFEIEDETDTIVFMSFDFDPTGLQPPFSFDIKIVPLNESGSPIDEIILPVIIEAPTDGDCNFPYEDIFEWISTEGFGDFYSAPMYPSITPGTVIGCCSDTGNSYYEASCANPNNNFKRIVNYENIFMVRLEFLKFFKSGDVLGEFDQFTQNIRPSLTDFCGGNAGYSGGDVHNSMWGTFTLKQSDCSLVIDQLEGETDGGFPLPFYAGAGPSVEYKLISRHFLKETRNGEGGTMKRIYERRTSSFQWHD